MYYFIVNPNSRTGTGSQIWAGLESILKSRNVPYEVFYTQPDHKAGEIIHELCQKGEPFTVGVLGGDGSINDAVQHLSRPELVTLGYIPSGSGNDFARDYQIPLDPKDALENILNPSKIADLDLGCVIAPNQQKRYFAGSSGMGFDAAVCVEVLDTPIKRFLNKMNLGKYTYLVIAAKQLITFKPYPLAVRWDDEEEAYYKNSYFACVMNQPFEGGGFKLAPLANPNDELLDVCLISGLPKILLPYLLPQAMAGKHLKFKKYVTYRTCKNITIKAKTPCPVHTDGEVFGLFDQVTIRLSEKRIKVITGPEY